MEVDIQWIGITPKIKDINALSGSWINMEDNCQGENYSTCDSLNLKYMKYEDKQLTQPFIHHIWIMDP